MLCANFFLFLQYFVIFLCQILYRNGMPMLLPSLQKPDLLIVRFMCTLFYHCAILCLDSQTTRLVASYWTTLKILFSVHLLFRIFYLLISFRRRLCWIPLIFSVHGSVLTKC